MVRGSLSLWLDTSQPWLHEGGNYSGKPGGEVTPVDVDVLVVGAGVTGCSLAYHLRGLDPKLKVAIVEARGISEGATGRNGGLMWPSLNAPWPTTVAQYGEAGAKQLIDFELHAFQDINNFIQEHGLADELQFSLFPEGALTLCESKEELDAELADLAAQVHMGVRPLVTPLTPQQLTSRLGAHNFVGGLLQEKVARVTAVRLAHALLKRAAAVLPENNLTVLQHTRVTAVQRLPAGSGARFKVICRAEDSGTVIKYGEGLKGHPGGQETVITAAKVIHCTNGYNHLLPQLATSGWLVPVRNQVVVTAPLPLEHPLPDAAFYARTGYVYWSRRHDGRVVLGGFRDVTSHMEWGTTDDSSEGLDAYVSQQMRAFLPAVLPDLFAATAAATAQSSKKPAAISTHSSRGRGQAGDMQVPMLAVAHTSVALDAAPPGWDKQGARPTAPPVPLQYELEWSGILGFTKDRWPLWGTLPPELASATPATTNGPTYEYACMGFSGHGMTRAYTCARNLALLLSGKAMEPSFPALVFSPNRVLARNSTSKL